MDGGTATVLAGLIVGVPGVITALAAIQASRHSKVAAVQSAEAVRQNATSNGKTSGEMTEEIREEQKRLAVNLKEETRKNDGARQLLMDHMSADALYQRDDAAWKARVEPIILNLPAAKPIPELDAEN